MTILTNQLKTELIENKELSVTFVINEFEKELVEAVMERCRWNQSKAAVTMGVSRGTMRKKLKEHFGNKYL